MKKTGVKMFIRTNFVRPDPGKEYHQITYHFDPGMEPKILYVRNLLFTYLGMKRNMFFEIGTSIHDLIETCGFKCTPNYKKTTIYSLVDSALGSMVSDGFIEPFGKPMDKRSSNELLRIRIIEENFYMSVRGAWGKDAINEPFFTIDYDEFTKIASIAQCNVPKMFYIYCYIKTRIRFRNPDNIPQAEPRMFFESIESMEGKLPMSYDTIRKYLAILCEIGLLKVGKLKTHAPGKKAPNVYVLNEEGWETELCNAIHYLDDKRRNNEKL